MTTQPLRGLRIIEFASFVAGPSAGMTLAQLGAEVIRIDPTGGAPDYHRWPVSARTGASLYWSALNRGKRSVQIDVRSPQGRELVLALATAPGPDAGIVVDNQVGRPWLGYGELAKRRGDVIRMHIGGRADGGPAVDYTVNTEVGITALTGPADTDTPVNHVLPAWDVSCGLYAALSVLTALRRRDATGEGSRIRLALDDVALATAANLGFLTEVMVNGVQRPGIGNAVFGQYGHDFTSSDGAAFMVVALTGRHFADLTELTGTTKAVAAVAEALEADFTDEGQRYQHRDVLNALFASWFSTHTATEVAAALSSSSVLWERYQSFAEVAASPRVTANPLFAPLDQPRIGQHLAPGLPMAVDGAHDRAGAAPELGQHSAEVLAEWLGMDEAEIAAMIESGALAT